MVSWRENIRGSAAMEEGRQSAQALLEARGLCRLDTENRWILRDLALRLYAGDRLAVVGPAGAGKTVLLRSLALLDPVDRGLVRWLGETVHGDRVPLFRSRVNYLHQSPAFAAARVEEVLAAPFELRVHHERSFDHRRAEVLLRRLGCEEGFLSKVSSQLSGGEAQMVGLVRALLLEPQILLLDEPTAALDPASTRRVEILVADWLQKKPGERAYIWVCHDEDQRHRVADRQLTIAAGSAS